MLKIGDYYFDLKVERKNIKNVYLRIINHNTLFVTCPKYVKDKDIENFVLSKADWILSTLNKIESREESSFLKIGENIFYKGKEYKFKIVSGKDKLLINDDEIILYTKYTETKDVLNCFYKLSKNELNKEVLKAVDKYLYILKDYAYNDYPKIKYKIMKAKWGVCYSRRNEMAFNLTLIHFKYECIEAVVLHELLHFIIPNHSKRFHEVLEYHMRDYKKRIKMLH